MSGLTPKQEIYVNELVKGHSQREAYRMAYPAALKWTDRAVDVAACKLRQNTKILIRYDALIEKSENEAIWTRREAILGLRYLLDVGKTEIERIYKAFSQEVEELRYKIDAADDPEQKRIFIQLCLDVLKQAWLSPAACAAMQRAINCLNRMHGYCKDFIVEATANVIFVGSENLHDE